MRSVRNFSRICISLWEALTLSVLALKKNSREIRDVETKEFIPCVRTHTLLGSPIITLLSLTNPSTHALIHALKYENDRYAARICAMVLAEVLNEMISDSASFSRRKNYITPIPLHPKREQERGFNQITRIISYLPVGMRDGTHLFHTPLLKRIRYTHTQAHSSRAQRLANMHDVFCIHPNAPTVKGSHVFLIDDVTTTGATLTSAARELRKSGARVTCIAIARA